MATHSDRIQRKDLEKMLNALEREMAETEPTMRALLELSNKREEMRRKISIIRIWLSGPTQKFRLSDLQ